MAGDTVSVMSFRDRLRGDDLFLQAVSQSDLKPIQKLAVRIAYRKPETKSDVDQFIEDGLAAKGDVNSMANGEIIKFIIEHLPEILELLLKFFG